MDVVLFFPPQWNPAAPYLSVPLLAGQLSSAGYDVFCCDLNINFYNDNLTKSKLLESVRFAEDYLKKYSRDYNFLHLKNFETLSLEQKIIVLRYEKILKYFSEYGNLLDKVINDIHIALNIMKSEKYYNPKLLYKAKIIIELALDIISLPFYPSCIDTGRYYSSLFDMSYQSIKYQVENSDLNMFYDYFKNKLHNQYMGCSIYGISIAAESQVVAALTLAKLLKQRENSKVILGGSLISRIKSSLLKHKEIFDEYCDYIIPEDGEISIIEIVNAIKGKYPINCVKNLIYKKNDFEVIQNDKNIEINVDKIVRPSLQGFYLDKYFSPDIVMLLQMSKGCYWGKCIFCSFSYKKRYAHRKIEEIVNEIKYYIKEYNIKYFRFTDDAIPPEFFKQLANAFISHKLNIKYIAFARFEDDFSLDLLKLIHESGCELIQWGLETSSKRLLNFINKGTENTNIVKILKDSDSAGISNFVFIMNGLPSQTFEEAKDTFEFVKANWKYIMGYTISRFFMEKTSILTDNYTEYGISEITKDETFLAHYNINGDILDSDKLKEIKKIYQDCLCKNGNKIHLTSFLLTDYIFLYILKYGKEYVKTCSI